VAVRSIPVLIEGESGTGKELLARAIHFASPRSQKPIVTVNCGAIPSELVESEFFGHKRGAFTGAIADRAGHFERANGGTLFLDEIGELSKSVQVKLLRALQEGEVTRVGETEARKVSVRVIAATNRNLVDEVKLGAFREDLFYRLAVAVIRLPPLREREGDVSLLIDALLKQVNERARDEPGFREKRLSPGARNLLLHHSWPGNVRELLNTLQRAAVWSDEAMIGVDAARAALLAGPAGPVGSDEILHRPIDQGIDLEEILHDVARHYLSRAMEASQGNRTQAAKLVGLASYQTLTNWMKKYELEK
jgi:transcriptional regulator with GAF, ATPase, and Fis domain